MLVLTRRIDEEIVVAGNIRLRILSVQGGKVRLGVEAPAGVSVDRAEVALRKGQAEAAQVAPPAPR